VPPVCIRCITERWRRVRSDRNALPSTAARQKQVETYRSLFEKMLRNMKKLAEGGTLTPEDKQARVKF